MKKKRNSILIGNRVFTATKGTSSTELLLNFLDIQCWEFSNSQRKTQCCGFVLFCSCFVGFPRILSQKLHTGPVGHFPWFPLFWRRKDLVQSQYHNLRKWMDKAKRIDKFTGMWMGLSCCLQLTYIDDWCISLPRL